MASQTQCNNAGGWTPSLRCVTQRRPWLRNESFAIRGSTRKTLGPHIRGHPVHSVRSSGCSEGKQNHVHVTLGLQKPVAQKKASTVGRTLAPASNRSSAPSDAQRRCMVWRSRSAATTGNSSTPVQRPPRVWVSRRRRTWTSSAFRSNVLKGIGNASEAGCNQSGSVATTKGEIKKSQSDTEKECSEEEKGEDEDVAEGAPAVEDVQVEAEPQTEDASKTKNLDAIREVEQRTEPFTRSWQTEPGFSREQSQACHKQQDHFTMEALARGGGKCEEPEDKKQIATEGGDEAKEQLAEDVEDLGRAASRTHVEEAQSVELDEHYEAVLDEIEDVRQEFQESAVDSSSHSACANHDHQLPLQDANPGEDKAPKHILNDEVQSPELDRIPEHGCTEHNVAAQPHQEVLCGESSPASLCAENSAQELDHMCSTCTRCGELDARDEAGAVESVAQVGVLDADVRADLEAPSNAEPEEDLHCSGDGNTDPVRGEAFTPWMESSSELPQSVATDPNDFRRRRRRRMAARLVASLQSLIEMHDLRRGHEGHDSSASDLGSDDPFLLSEEMNIMRRANDRMLFGGDGHSDSDDWTSTAASESHVSSRRRSSSSSSSSSTTTNSSISDGDLP